MYLSKVPDSRYDANRGSGRVTARLVFPVLVCLGFLVSLTSIFGQGIESVGLAQSSRLRIGEKLSYNISFGGFADAGHAEIQVVSRGALGKIDVIELRSRIKTFDMVSATFFLLDESRTVYASPDTGLPVYISRVSNVGPLPKETVANYLTVPTSSFDFLTLIYKAREASGTGAFPLFENEQLYTVNLQTAGAEKVKTEAGEFDTVTSTVQSDLLTASGIKDLRINFSNDEQKLPVLIRFKTAKGQFRATLSSITLTEPAVPVGTPTPVPTPRPPTTPRPTPTPEPYVENRPLAPELGFQLGESFDYQVTAGGRPVGVINLSAKERTLLKRKEGEEDSLLLIASVKSTEPGAGVLNIADRAKAYVDPDTLAPKLTDTRFTSTFAGLNQTVTFDRRTGTISFGGAQGVDGPVGTHSLISLIYAMRSFNLKPSKDLSNPVNDTRVAVFWESKPYVFTLRPSNPEDITINGEKTSAQLITIITGHPQLDALAIKVWLGTESRIPLRFAAGPSQAELITQTPNIIR